MVRSNNTKMNAEKQQISDKKQRQESHKNGDNKVVKENSNTDSNSLSTKVTKISNKIVNTTKNKKETNKSDSFDKTGKRVNQYVHWCFTYNNYAGKLTDLQIKLNAKCRKYVFQEETGECGTKHLQGSIELKVRMRLTELKKLNKEIHWEATRNVEAADKYACKEETRTGKVYMKHNRRAFVRTKSKFDDMTPRKDVLDIIHCEPDNRTINWIWSAEGGVGKTTTAAYIEQNYDNVCIVNGKGADIKNSVIKHLETGELDVLIVNVPRCNEGHVSFSAIEEIKDGLIYSGKYEGGFANIEPPHVIVMSNFYPETNKLSADRWNILCVDEPVNMEDIDEPEMDDC